MTGRAPAPPAQAAGELPAGADPATRERILQAGISCITQYGRAKTTLQDVAVAAGVSRATIYRYFADRGALFGSIRDFELERDGAQISRRADATRTLPEAVAVIAEVLSATASRYRMRNHLAAGDESLVTYVAMNHHRQRERVAQLVRPYVTRAVDRGELRAGVSAAEAEEWIALTLAQVTSLTSVHSVDLADPAAVGQWFGRLSCTGICADG
jgi:AcrR family transcriptional regulator